MSTFWVCVACIIALCVLDNMWNNWLQHRTKAKMIEHNYHPPTEKD